MILVTGGLGFIGRHVTRALVDLGEECVVVQRGDARMPAAYSGNAEYSGNIAVERADVGDRAALMEIARRHRITGIVHLAGSVPWPPGADEPVAGARKAVDSLLNVVEVALDRQVTRLGIASTIGVYGGAPGHSPFRENVPLPMTGAHVIPAFKKVGELLTDHLAGVTGLATYSFRISAAWGPGGRTASPFFAAPQLVHAAVRGVAPELSAPVHAGDAVDMCYVKDCGRAVAMLQLAPALRHSVYNVAGGRATTYGELVAAIRAVVPDAQVDLREGTSGAEPLWLDTSRLREDTGYLPVYDTERAVADYIAWLRAGNER